MNRKTFSRLLVWVSVGLLCLGAVASWRWRFNNPAIRAADCVAVTGPLYSATQWGTGKQRMMDIYLRGNPLLFRVPTADNGAHFDPATFRANNPPGTTVTLQVRKDALRQPFYPAFSSRPLVWLNGLSDTHTVYYSIAQARKWDIRNRQAGLYIAIVATILSVGSLLAVIIAEFRGFDWAGKPMKSPSLEMKLRIGQLQFFAGMSGMGFSWLINRYWLPDFSLSARGYPLMLVVCGFFRTISAQRQLKEDKK